MKKIVSVFLLFISILTLVACQSVKLTVNDTDINLTVNEEYEVEFTTNAKELEWTTSNPQIATVADGVIKAVGAGEVTITVQVKDSKTKVEIQVKIEYLAPTKVNITGAGNVVVGATLQLTGSVEPTGATPTLSWSSEDVTIATVDNTGKVTGVKAGSVKIKAKAVNDVEAEVTVNVVNPYPTGITITGPITAVLDKTETYTATVAPILASQEVTWSVDDASMATISDAGVLTPLKAGTVKVIATSKVKTDVKAEITVTISVPVLTGITVNGPTTIVTGQIVTYTFAPIPAKAVTEVIWSINNTELATIDETGKLTALKVGAVKVIATSKTDATIKAEKDVNIVEPSKNLLVDANLTGESGNIVQYKNEDFIIGVSAFTSLEAIKDFIQDDSIIYLKKGTYSTGLTITKKNVHIVGPNEEKSVFESVQDRLEEAIISAKIDISNTEGFVLDGVALTGFGQIYASKLAKDVTIKNVYAYNGSIAASEGVIFLGATVEAEFTDKVEVTDSRFIDSENGVGSGYRGVRIQNAKDVTVRNNYFYGYWDSVRLEGQNAAATGLGARGYVIIENNKFAMGVQYPIFLSIWSATSVEINNNEISVSPNAGGTAKGLIYLNNYQPKTDVKSVVNIKNNHFVSNTDFHDLRINSKGATSAQLEVNVNNNIYDEVPLLSGTTQYNHIIDHTETVTDFKINGKYNVYAYTTEVKATYFKNTEYQPFYRSVDEIGALFVNPAWQGSTVGSDVTYNNVTAKYGTNGFATLQEALAAAKEKDKIFLLPGTHTGNVTINKNNIKITSYNGSINPNTKTRNTEAIYTGVITLGKKVENVEIAGIKFTDNAQILNTLGDAGTASATTVNINGFMFKNNIVESGLASGKGFVNFKEASSCYSHNLSFVDNIFTVKATGSTLENIIYIDNNAKLIVTGNVFKDLPKGAFYVVDTTKGLAGNTYVQGNEFKNIGTNAFWVNWFSNLPGTKMYVKVVDNKFTSIGGEAIHFENLNNGDVMDAVNIQYNVFDGFDSGVYFNRVSTTANIHVNFNIFKTVPTNFYVKDGKDAGTNSPATMDAKHNFYMNNGAKITPDAAKFVGGPDYTTNYNDISEVPVYAGEGEIVVTNIEITPITGPFYLGDKYQLEIIYAPSNTTTKEVTYASSNTQVATVSADGLVNLLSVGKATITVTSVRNPDLKATFEIDVVNFVGLEVYDSGSGVVEVGKTTQLDVSVYPTTVTGTITYKSLNTNIATVDANGKVTGVAEGTAVIEVKINDVVSTITIVVSKARTTEIDPIQFILDANINKGLARNISTFGNTTKTELVKGSVSRLWYNDGLKVTEVLMEGRPKVKLTSVEFIVVHDTGNNNVGANALMHSNYLKNNTSTSWHYTVDDEGAYKHLPLDEIGYHAGDGLRAYGLNDTGVTATTPKPVITISADGYYVLNGTKSTVKAPLVNGATPKTSDITPSGIFTTIQDGKYFINNTYYNADYKVIANHGGGSNGIGIESCVDQGSDLYATWQNLAKLVAQLLVQFDLSIDRVMQHNNFSGKNCPQTLRTAGLWDYFIANVEFEYQLLTTYKDYTFTFKSNNPDFVDDKGKIINLPRFTTEVSYTVTVTNNSGYNKSVTLYSKIPGTKLID